MPSKETPEPSPSETNSAEDAQPVWLLGEFASPEYTKTNCAKCEVTTVHQWTKVTPFNIQLDPTDFDVMVETNQKSKRLTLCTQCANLRLIT